MSKIKLDLTHQSIASAIPYLKKITGKMDGNAKFTTLAEETTALELATTNLDTANTNYDKSVAESTQLLTLRNNAFDAANAAAHTLASGAQKISTDAADLQGGGWDLVAESTPVGALSPPANFHATAGDASGSVDLAWDPQHGAQTHIAHFAAAPTGPWTQGYIGKKSSCTIPGLPSGVEQWFRVQASGTAGLGDWSGPIVKRPT